jgi:hypothetical protein
MTIFTRSAIFPLVKIQKNGGKNQDGRQALILLSSVIFYAI